MYDDFMLRFLLLSLGFSLYLCSELSYARTLFIDFNNAGGEIAVFQKGRKGQPADVVVVPSYVRITPKQRSAALQANAALEKFTRQALDCAVSAKKKNDHCADVYDRIRQAELDRVQATGEYSADDLKADLLALIESEKDNPFDMLVISGHHELGYYRGELTQVKVLQFAEIVTESRHLFRQVNTVVLLGCGTGTKVAYGQYLAPLFPGVPLIFGAEDRAPTRDEARNLAYIRKLLAVRSQLLSAQTVRDIEPLYQSLLAKNWPVSLLWRQNVIFFKDGAELF